MKHFITKTIHIVVLAIGCVSFFGCTKTSGCEFVEGDDFLTGVFHYSKTAIEIPKWPGSPVDVLNVNAYLVRDNSTGDFWDTIVITKSSVPNEYRKESEKHVAVSIVNTTPGGTCELRHDFYKLLCIEEIE